MARFMLESLAMRAALRLSIISYSRNSAGFLPRSVETMIAQLGEIR